MLKIVTRGVALILVGACLALSACGDSNAAPAVVRVGNNTITAATVKHWIEIENVTSHGGARVTQPQPKASLPVPPEYKDCIAYLTQTSATPLTSEEARVKCATQYKIFKETVLGILISYYWDTEEGAAKGVHVSQAEVKQYLKQLFRHPGELSRYQRLTHTTDADERLIISGKIMTAKLVALSSEHTHSQAERVRAITKHIEEEGAKWTPRTSCRPGYVVPQCKQFHGPKV
jgi:hypothetical protein